MLNSYSRSNSCVKINSITGTIVKNYRDSFFKRFHLKSELANMIFDTMQPYIGVYYETKKPVVVLQMMMCGDSEVIAELMWKEDFDKLFDEAKGVNNGNA